jgi:WD40 repeat protein
VFHFVLAVRDRSCQSSCGVHISVLAARMAGDSDVAEHVRMKFYIVGIPEGSSGSTIKVLDGANGTPIASVSANYNPDILLSPDNTLLIVSDSNISRPDTYNELRIYDASSLKLLHCTPISDRPIYNVAPSSSSSIAASNDGRYVYMLKMEQLDPGKANYSLLIFDLKNWAFLTKSLELPENLSFLLTLGGRSELFLVFEGDHLEGVSWVEPVAHGAVENVYAFDHAFDRTTEQCCGQSSDYLIVQVGVSSNGGHIYMITRNSSLRIIDSEKRIINPPVRLNLSDNLFIPYGDLIVFENFLVVGASSKVNATQGLIESVYVVDRATLKTVRTFPVSPLAHRVVLSSDGSRLFASSWQEGSITTYDFYSGQVLGRTPRGAERLAWFLIGN